MRTCIGCRTSRPAATMWRCTLDPASGAAVLSRTAPGRGAWVCSPTCFDAAATRRRFERAWRRPVPTGALDAAREQLRVATAAEPGRIRVGSNDPMQVHGDVAQWSVAAEPRSPATTSKEG